MKSFSHVRSWIRSGAAALFAVAASLLLSSAVNAGPTQSAHPTVRPHPPTAGDNGPGDLDPWSRDGDMGAQGMEPSTQDFPSFNATGNRFYTPNFNFGPWLANEYALPQCQAAFWSGDDAFFADMPSQCSWLQNYLPMGLGPDFGFNNAYGQIWPPGYNPQFNPYGLPFIVH